VEVSELFAKGSEIFVLFGRIRPRPIDSNGGLNIRPCLLEVPELAVIAAKLEFDVRIIGELTLRLQKDRPAMLKGVVVADGVGKRNPNFRLFRAEPAEPFGSLP